MKNKFYFFKTKLKMSQDFFNYTCDKNKIKKEEPIKKYSDKGILPDLSENITELITDSEKCGTPLQTSWTFWLDK